MPYGFTFDNVHSDDLSLIVEGAVPVMAPTRDATKTIPGRHGQIDFKPEFDSRRIDLQCTVLCDTHQELIRAVHRFTETFNPLKGAKKLIFDDEPSRWYFARYSGDINSFERMARWGTFRLPLVCHDPFQHGDRHELDNVDGNPPNVDQLAFDATAVAHTLYNRGQLETPVVITITGACSNPKYTNLTTGRGVQVQGTFASGDKLIIDTGKNTVYRQDASGGTYSVGLTTIQYDVVGAPSMVGVAGVFGGLAVGQNDLQFESDDVPNATIQFDWDCLYL